MNLVLGLLVVAGSSVTVWAGITDPEGGVWAGLRNAIRGQANTKHASTVAAAFVNDLATVAATAGSATYTGTGGGGGGASVPTSYTGGPVKFGPSGDKRIPIVTTARGWLGTPYKWGGNTRAGVDCSGLTKAVYAAHGINLPRVSAAQAAAGRNRPIGSVQPADLVFWGTPAHHVAIYIGSGQVIHAPYPGKVVRVESIASISKSLHTPAYARDVVGY